jgi:hypothetical protein
MNVFTRWRSLSKGSVKSGQMNNVVFNREQNGSIFYLFNGNVRLGLDVPD